MCIDIAARVGKNGLSEEKRKSRFLVAPPHGANSARWRDSSE
jgi:hypothetical protein